MKCVLEHPQVLLSLLTVAMLLPFINKPFHIDDPLFLWSAKQIRHHPLDPYGFDVNWYNFAEPMSGVLKNPPLASYYLAAASYLVGWSEAGLHAAMILPAIALVLGTYRLARQLDAPPMLAAIATLASPVVLLSASTIMCDVLMTCLFVWSVVLWIDGMRSGRTGLLFLAGFLAALSALSKYFGVALIPLLLVHGLLHRRGRPGAWIFTLLLTGALLAVYQLLTRRIYGHGLLFDAAQYATQKRWGGRAILDPLLIGVVFTGGCCATIAFVALAAMTSRTAVAVLVATILAIALFLVLKTIGTHAIRADSAIAWPFLVQLTLWCVSGVAIFALSAFFAIRRRSPESIVLALWIFGTFIFATLVNWTVAGRSILPLAPPAAVIAAAIVPSAFPRRVVAWSAVVFGAILALLVTAADTSLAQTARQAALEADRACKTHLARSATIYFTGHWGFQEYMQQLGATPIDVRRSALRVGDAFVEPRTNTNIFRLPEAGLLQARGISFQPMRWLATMDESAHAGFYYDAIGPLPFAFAPVPPQDYRVCIVIRNMSGKPQ